MLRRLLSRRWLTGYFVVGCLFAAATARLFVWPSSASLDDLEPADAVVMFAGGTGERLDTALAVMDRGLADTLVLTHGNIRGWARGNRLCSGDAQVDFEVLCPTPDPDNTRGEAGTIAALARNNEWTSLISVTSNYHVVRADLRLTRCFDGSVQRVNAGPNRSRRAWPSLIVHEWLGLAQAIVQRDC